MGQEDIGGHIYGGLPWETRECTVRKKELSPCGLSVCTFSSRPGPPPGAGACFPKGTMWSRTAAATGPGTPLSLWKAGHKQCTEGLRTSSADSTPNQGLRSHPASPWSSGTENEQTGGHSHSRRPHRPEASATRRGPGLVLRHSLGRLCLLLAGRAPAPEPCVTSTHSSRSPAHTTTAPGQGHVEGCGV